MDDLGRLLEFFRDDTHIVEEIGPINTMRPLDRAVYDKKGVTTDHYSFILLAPIYDQSGKTIESVKYAYGVHIRTK